MGAETRVGSGGIALVSVVPTVGHVFMLMNRT